jgi:hypothetical protein
LIQGCSQIRRRTRDRGDQQRVSPRPRGGEEIDAALEVLATVSSLAGQGHEEFDRSEALRLALAMCWVSVGSQLKQFAAS